VTLDRVEAPDAHTTPHSAGHDALSAALAGQADEDAYASYERDTAARIAEYLRRADRLGPALEAMDRDEAGALLGRRVANSSERDAALEQIVMQRGASLDGDWVRYFHRHLQRTEILLAPVLRELEGASIQRFERSSGGREEPS
jgi:hypothetical protein